MGNVTVVANQKGKSAMLKNDVIAGPSCLTKAADDEPLFILRANDELAPYVVRMWAEMFLASKRRKNDGLIHTAAILKYKEALRCATDMEEWYRKNNTDIKLPLVVMTIEEAYATHTTRYSDSTLYDETCDVCGATDFSHLLKVPCDVVKKEVLVRKGIVGGNT